MSLTILASVGWSDHSRERSRVGYHGEEVPIFLHDECVERQRLSHSVALVQHSSEDVLWDLGYVRRSFLSTETY